MVGEVLVQPYQREPKSPEPAPHELYPPLTSPPKERLAGGPPLMIGPLASLFAPRPRPRP